MIIFINRDIMIFLMRFFFFDDNNDNISIVNLFIPDLFIYLFIITIPRFSNKWKKQKVK